LSDLVNLIAWVRQNRNGVSDSGDFVRELTEDRPGEIRANGEIVRLPCLRLRERETVGIPDIERLVVAPRTRPDVHHVACYVGLGVQIPLKIDRLSGCRGHDRRQDNRGHDQNVNEAPARQGKARR
jgi:hypothetical protein